MLPVAVLVIIIEPPTQYLSLWTFVMVTFTVILCTGTSIGLLHFVFWYNQV